MTEAKARMLSIEITSQCTSRCIMCPHDVLDRKNKHMPLNDILSIIDSAYDIGIREIHPHLFGEPTMHPRYAELLYTVRDKYPDIKIVAYTNGYGLHNDKINEVILNTVDRIVISIDGATDNTMKKIRPGLDSIKIREGVRKLHENRNKNNKNKPTVTIRMTKMPENIHEVNIYKDKWKLYCDNIMMTYLQNFHGFKELPSPIRNNLPCDRIFYAVVVTVNKNVVLCCDDYKEEVILGNLDNNFLKNIWYGEKAEQIRKLHIDKNISLIPMCSKCTYLGYL